MALTKQNPIKVNQQYQALNTIFIISILLSLLITAVLLILDALLV